MKIIKPIIEALKSAREVVLAGHTNPDADSMGSCFAMAFALEKLGIKPYVLLEEYGEKYNVLPGFQFVYKHSLDKIEPDIFMILDCGDRYRLGKYKNAFPYVKTIVVDHHLSNKNFGDYNYIDKNASSTCELLYPLIKSLTEMDTNIAACLYAGIVTDTGGFRFRATTPETLRIAGELMEFDFPFWEYSDKLMYRQNLVQFKAFSSIINNFVMLEDLGLVYVTVTEEQLKELNISYNDIDGVSQFLNRIEEADIAVFVYEKGGKTKMSLRSKETDVNELASRFGGGGHKYAGGLEMVASPEEAIGKVIEVLKLSRQNKLTD